VCVCVCVRVCVALFSAAPLKTQTMAELSQRAVFYCTVSVEYITGQSLGGLVRFQPVNNTSVSGPWLKGSIPHPNRRK
jgi:hypothetical protein